MSSSKTDRAAEESPRPPPLRRDAAGQAETVSLADVIEWFMDHDPRVAVIRHPAVEELFQWKQAESARRGEQVYQFNRAEDRLAVGIVQALFEHDTEEGLHGWISQLLNALDDAAKTYEAISDAYQLRVSEESSALKEAAKIPAAGERALFLTCCWLETLCTAEIRVVGWVYQELYGRPFSPR